MKAEREVISIAKARVEWLKHKDKEGDTLFFIEEKNIAFWKEFIRSLGYSTSAKSAVPDNPD